MGERHPPPPSAPPPPVGLIYSASLYPPNLKVMRLEAKAGWAGRATRRGHAAIFFGPLAPCVSCWLLARPAAPSHERLRARGGVVSPWRKGIPLFWV